MKFNLVCSSEGDRILRLGGPKKIFRGEAFFTSFFFGKFDLPQDSHLLVICVAIITTNKITYCA